MKAFMDKDFLLETETEKKLFHQYASGLPIVDYHCHIPAEEIAKNISFENITKLWLNADHYKWRFMRSCGIEEHYITGDASDKEKFMKWATCLGKAIGNPLFTWSHLELQRYFGYDNILCEDSAEEVWEICNHQLQSSSFCARDIINQSNVKLICTTDDPIDSLKWHQQIAKDPNFTVQVLPSFRPDLALQLENENYLSYIHQLEIASKLHITDFSSLKQALSTRLDFFIQNGCRVSDHGLSYVMYAPCSIEEAQAIFSKRLKGFPLSKKEILQFKTTLLLFLAETYAKKGIIMQLHYGCKRDNNTKMLEKMGINTGFDCIHSYTPADQLADFLNALDRTDNLPQTILYSLNPNDNQIIASIIGCFQNADAITKIQQGSAWWFNDNKDEITRQLSSFANQSALSGFVGMLTDSRSFVSYTRHEYFRRILCHFIGSLVENGEYPNNEHLLSQLVKDICYNNAVTYFGFALDTL